MQYNTEHVDMVCVLSRVQISSNTSRVSTGTFHKNKTLQSKSTEIHYLPVHLSEKNDGLVQDCSNSANCVNNGITVVLH